jgi:hypothetical protein
MMSLGTTGLILNEKLIFEHSDPGAQGVQPAGARRS